jgi:DNA (cytosine-5)-methyltransferase 1
MSSPNSREITRSLEQAPAISHQPERPRGSVVDVFCGAGGLTHGFCLEGYSIAAGIDVDESCP